MSIFDLFRRRRATVIAPPPDPLELFTQDVERALRAHGQVTAIERLPEMAALRVRCGDAESTLFLQNLFAETRELAPEDRPERVRAFLATTLDGEGADLSDWEVARPNLMLAVRPCIFASGAAPGTGLASSFVARGFAPFLDAMLVVDTPSSIGYVSRTTLEKWPVDEDEAFAAALRNLATQATAQLERYSDTHGPVWHLPGEDVYAASRLLLPGWLASMRGRVDGRVLAIIPERSTLLIGGDANPELVRWLAEAAQREFASSVRSLSSAVYTLDAGAARVVPYTPDRTSGTATVVRMGHAMLRARTYEEQKNELDAYHEKNGVDLFVASATLMRLEDGRPYDYCVWTEGVEALLPVTDVVVAGGGAKGDGSRWMATVPFDVAREIGGRLWTAASLPFGPERFRVSGAITPEQKAALLAASRPTDQLA